jgi:hypothetical protein
MEEPERFPENFGWEFGALFWLRIPFMANASRLGGMHYKGQKAEGPDVAELIDCL